MEGLPVRKPLWNVLPRLNTNACDCWWRGVVVGIAGRLDKQDSLLGKVPTNMRLSWENRRCNSSIEAQPLPLVAVRYSWR